MNQSKVSDEPEAACWLRLDNKAEEEARYSASNVLKVSVSDGLLVVTIEV